MAGPERNSILVAEGVTRNVSFERTRSDCSSETRQCCPAEGCCAALALCLLQLGGLEARVANTVRKRLIRKRTANASAEPEYISRTSSCRARTGLRCLTSPVLSRDESLQKRAPSRSLVSDGGNSVFQSERGCDGGKSDQRRVYRSMSGRSNRSCDDRPLCGKDLDTLRLYWPSLVAKADAVRQLFDSIQDSGLDFRVLFPEGAQMDSTEVEDTLNLIGMDAFAVEYIMENHVGNIDSVDCDAVFRDLVSEHFVAFLASSGLSLRAFFHRLDKHSCGHIQFSAFTRACQRVGLDGLREEDVRVIYSLLGGSAGNGIVYRDLFNAFVPYLLPEMVAPLRTIRSVVVITRHGARFPLKPFPHSCVWPAEKTFWDSYGGKLSPTGVAQHDRLGRRFRHKYIEVEGLLDPQDPDSTQNIYAYTGKSDRTMMSAQSFLHGMFPDIAVSFELEHSELELQPSPRTSSPLLGASCSSALEQQTLQMRVSSKEYTPIIHGFKCSKRYSQLKAAAFEAGKFEQWSTQKRYLDVLDKLWAITGFSKLNPERPALERLKHLQSCAQQISVERAHRHVVLSNATGSSLQTEDEQLVKDVGDYICRLRYCGNTPDEQHELSRRAVGLLPKEIVGRFRKAIAMEEERTQAAAGKPPQDPRRTPRALTSASRIPSSGSRTPRGSRRPSCESEVPHDGTFTLISAHDNSLMALLAHMGFNDFDIPNFAAFLTFELHKSPDLGWHVHVAYNPDPDKYDLEGFIPAPMQKQPNIGEVRGFSLGHSLGQMSSPGNKPPKYFKIPDGGKYGVSWESAETGSMTFAEFEENFISSRGAFMDGADWEMDAGVCQDTGEVHADGTKSEPATGKEFRGLSIDTDEAIFHRTNSVGVSAAGSANANIFRGKTSGFE